MGSGKAPPLPSPAPSELLVDYLVDMAAKTGTIQWRTPGAIRDKESRYPLRCNRLQVFSQTARDTPHGGSTPPASTRWTLHEHLLFQRRLRRQGVAVMSKQKSRVKVLVCLDPRFFIYLCLIGIWCPIIINRPPQAMRVLIHTHLFCLLGGLSSLLP